MTDSFTADRLDPIPFVEAEVNYIHPDCEAGVLYEEQRESSTLVFDPRTVRVRDGRGERFSLAEDGFQLVHEPASANLLDPDQVHGAYAEQMAELVKGLTGASEVWVFNDVTRLEDQPQANKPAHSVHVDFDRETLEGFIRAMHPEPERVLTKRFANINLWRPIAPVERAPLAVCEGASIARGDLRTGIIRMRPDEPMPIAMSGFNIAHNPAHRWWWFPHMQPDEVLVFTLYDTDPDAPQFTAHTAFEDPTSPPDAKPRQSLEIRTIAVFD